MGYRPRKRNAIVQLRPRNISYEEVEERLPSSP